MIDNAQISFEDHKTKTSEQSSN